jgi:hypothetical protein
MQAVSAISAPINVHRGLATIASTAVNNRRWKEPIGGGS